MRRWRWRGGWQGSEGRARQSIPAFTAASITAGAAAHRRQVAHQSAGEQCPGAGEGPRAHKAGCLEQTRRQLRGQAAHHQHGRQGLCQRRQAAQAQHFAVGRACQKGIGKQERSNHDAERDHPSVYLSTAKATVDRQAGAHSKGTLHPPVQPSTDFRLTEVLQAGCECATGNGMLEAGRKNGWGGCPHGIGVAGVRGGGGTQANERSAMKGAK